MHLQENKLFDLDVGVKVTGKIAQYPLHHVTYTPAKFEVTTSNSFGEDTITRSMKRGHMDRWTMDRLWYKINIPFFC